MTKKQQKQHVHDIVLKLIDLRVQYIKGEIKASEYSDQDYKYSKELILIKNPDFSNEDVLGEYCRRKNILHDMMLDIQKGKITDNVRLGLQISMEFLGIEPAIVEKNAKEAMENLKNDDRRNQFFKQMNTYIKLGLHKLPSMCVKRGKNVGHTSSHKSSSKKTTSKK